MSTTLKNAVVRYLRTGSPAVGTRKEYFATLRKWTAWGGGMAIEKLSRREIRDFLDWVYEAPSRKKGSIRAAQLTRPVKIFAQSCRGHGNATSSTYFRGSPNRGRNVTSQADITLLRPRSTPSISLRTGCSDRAVGISRSQWGDIGARCSSCSSTMALTPERFGLASQAMNQSFGNTSPGTLSLRTVTSNSSRVGDGSSIVA